MKLSELIQRVDQSKENTSIADPDDFTSALWLGYIEVPCQDFEARVKAYYLSHWLCTDSWVGRTVYYMDGEPVAVGYQQGRKWDNVIEFVSEDAAKKVRDYLLTFLSQPSGSMPLADLDEDLGEGYQVEYGSQLLQKFVPYKGKEREVVQHFGVRNEGSSDLWHVVGLRMDDGSQEIANLDDILIPYHITATKEQA